MASTTTTEGDAGEASAAETSAAETSAAETTAAETSAAEAATPAEPVPVAPGPVAPGPASPPAGLSRADRFLVLGTVLAALVLVLGRIGSFGIWDPWELAAADLARNVADGEAVEATGAPLGAWLVAQGFSLFGIHEWAGRLPIALAGLLALAVLGVGAARAAGLRTGLVAALIAASSPLVLLNSRTMMGAAPGLLGSALVFFFALELASVDEDEGRSAADVQKARIAAGVGLALALLLATSASGALLGGAPPLLGVGAALLARGEAGLSAWRGRIATGVVIVALLAGLGVARAVLADVEGYSAWLGGAPRGTSPGTFEVVIEQVFHGFAPWTALLPIGFGWLAFREEDPTRPRREALLGLGAVAWAAFAFAAVSVYDARYGSAPFPAPLALAVVAAIGVEESRRRGGAWAAGVVAFLLAMLLVRDFRGYPITPTGALALSSITAPEAFNPWLGWAGTLVPFAVLAFLGLSRDPEDSFEALKAELGVGQGAGRVALGALRLGLPIDAIRAALDKGGGALGWLAASGTLLAGVLAYGLTCWVLPDEERPQAIVPAITGALALAGLLAWGVLKLRAPSVLSSRRALAVGLPVLVMILLGLTIATGILSMEGLSSLAVRVGKYLFFVPFAAVLGAAAFRAVRYGFHALGDAALVPMLAMGVVCGGYTSLRWQPELSQHFSPREVYDTYNGLAADGEPLGEYRVSGRAAAYYTEGEIEEIDSEAAALEFLGREERVWLAFRADDLAQLDRAYRARADRHLFIADARSSNVLLATNQPISGRADENYLAEAILDAPPPMEHTVGANFDRRIELLGYDLEAPRGERIGPGDQIVVTWYWRCTAPVPGSYQIFLHVDGMGQRLNGDHEPVEGRYPVRLWSAGDIIVDRQELRVPANFPPGTYSFHIGFYSGETRLEVVEGPEDDANRAIAGSIVVR